MIERNHLYYNKSLTSKASHLRKKMTKAESCLWKYILRARQLDGYQFRRQRPVLHYIADFLCKDLMLIIEVDGVTHNEEIVRKNDIIRQMELERVGFNVIRFTDDDVLNKIGDVRISILDFISRIFPTPLPPPAGDKN